MINVARITSVVPMTKVSNLRVIEPATLTNLNSSLLNLDSILGDGSSEIKQRDVDCLYGSRSNGNKRQASDHNVHSSCIGVIYWPRGLWVNKSSPRKRGAYFG